MFSTEEGVQDFLNWLQNESGYNQAEKKTVLQRITEWLNDIIEAIRDVMNSGELNGVGKAFAQEQSEALSDIRKQFLEVLDGYGENYRKGGAVEGEKSTNSTGIRFSESIKNYPYDMQTVISDYIDSVDTRLLKLINKVKNHSKEYFERYTICETSDKLIKDLEKTLKIDVFGYKNAINTNAIHHIIKRHGSSGKADSSMANDNDIARMRYIIENYDSLELLTDENGNIVYSDEFRNSDNTQAPLIRLSKRINGTYYLVEAVPENKYKKIWVVSAYIKNSSAVTQAPKKSGSYLASPTSANNSISNSTENVKDSLKLSFPLTDLYDLNASNIEKVTELGRVAAQLTAHINYIGSSQTKRVLSELNIQAVSRELKKEYSSKADMHKLTAELLSLYQKFENGRVSQDVVKVHIDNIVDMVINDSVYMKPDISDAAKEILHELRICSNPLENHT